MVFAIFDHYYVSLLHRQLKEQCQKNNVKMKREPLMKEFYFQTLSPTFRSYLSLLHVIEFFFRDRKRKRRTDDMEGGVFASLSAGL